MLTGASLPKLLGSSFSFCVKAIKGNWLLREKTGAYKVSWCEGVWEVCLATEDVCTAHTSAPLLPSGFELHLDQCLYDLGASVSPRG